MLADIESGLIGTVIVKDSSRISRNWLDLGNWFKRCQNDGAGIKYIAVLDGVSMFDSILGDIQAALVQHYKKNHSGKIKQGIANKKRRLAAAGS